MSGYMNSTRRRSLPLISARPSENQRGQRPYLKSHIFNADPPVSTFGSVVYDSDYNMSSYRKPTANFQIGKEDLDHVNSKHSSDEDETLFYLPDDTKRDQVEALKMKFYQKNNANENLPRFEAQASYLAQDDNKGNRRTLLNRRRQHSAPEGAEMVTPEAGFYKEDKGDDDVKLDLKISDRFEGVMKVNTEFLQLPSIKKEEANPSHTLAVSGSESETNIDFVSFVDESRMGDHRAQQTLSVGSQEISLERDLTSKVKKFLQEPQPLASTQSLRVKKIPDFKLQRKVSGNVYTSGAVEQLRGVPINTDTCPLMSHFSKDRKWYYQDKRRKCRYLRVPESPTPPISYVFAKDELADSVYE